MTPLLLVPGQVSLDQQLPRSTGPRAAISLDAACRPKVEVAAARALQQAAEGTEPVYGVNTGFGKLASHKIAAKDTSTLQRNLILSHCCGVGSGCAASSGAADDVAEAAVIRARCFGRAMGTCRIAATDAGVWCDTGDPGARFGRRVGRSGTTGAYDRCGDR